MQTKTGRVEPGRTPDPETGKPAVAVDKSGEPISDPSKKNRNGLQKLKTALHDEKAS